MPMCRRLYGPFSQLNAPKNLSRKKKMLILSGRREFGANSGRPYPLEEANDGEVREEEEEEVGWNK